MLDLITIGDSLVDIFLSLNNKQAGFNNKKTKLSFDSGEKIMVKDSYMATGGNAANVASGVAKLGKKVAIYTELGDDLHGHAIMKTFHKRKINTTLIDINKENTTRYSIVLNTGNERTILSHHPEIKYNLPKLPKTKLVYFTSLGFGFEKVEEKLIDYLKKNPSTFLAMNPGSYQIEKGKKYLKNILPMVQILFVNKEEAAKLVGKKRNEKQYFQAFHKLGVKTVVITNGMNGSYASDGSFAYKMGSYPVKVLSKTGAGDAYTSGFLTAFLNQKTLSEAMLWGTANSSLVIEQFGSHEGLASVSALKSRIAKFSKIKPSALI